MWPRRQDMTEEVVRHEGSIFKGLRERLRSGVRQVAGDMTGSRHRGDIGVLHRITVEGSMAVRL